MIESIAVEYRAQAMRYHALAEQAGCPARKILYRRLARGYLTLADLARPHHGTRDVEPAFATGFITGPADA